MQPQGRNQHMLTQPWFIHQVPVTAGWPEVMWILSLPVHMAGAAGIKSKPLQQLLEQHEKRRRVCDDF